MESWRKAYGALKDSTKVGLAKVNSNFKDLDIAIVKATNHDESPPKERHVRKIFIAVSINRPRADVGYCIHALSRRLAKTKSWIVAVKSLIVVHRTIREGDPGFKEELMHYSRRGNLLQMSNFKDDSSSLAWDCSAWIRTYALFLEERVECFRNINFDIESDKTPKSPGMSKTFSKTRQLNGDELLEQLPQLQQLLYRLVCCQPEGAACRNFLIQYALALVVKESFKIYCAINDGIVNLVDGFFDMPKHEAVKALNIYKKAGRQADHLADFYGFCKNLDLARTFQFPILTQPPATFLATMEEYIKEAPQTGSLSNKRLEYKEMKEEPQKPDEPDPIEIEKHEVEKVEKKEEIVEEKPPKEVAPLVSVEQPVDLLGLNEINPKGVELEESNALALAIIQPGNDLMSTSNALTEIGKTSGWELALVTAPSNTNKPQVATATKMAGGFDNFLLNSLYEDDASRRKLQMQSAGYNKTTPQNPYNQPDPFALSSNIAPPTNVHVAMLTQQEQMLMQQQQLMMMQQQQNMMMQQQQQQNMMMMVPHTPYGAQYSQPQQMTQMGPLNPFDYTVGYPQSKPMQPHGNQSFF